MPASMKHLTDRKLNLTSLLARWKDGLYYTAAILKCEKSRGRCLVCFEDGSELWVHKRDLHIQLTADQIGEPDDILCCVCDEDDSEEPNVIVLCDICNQAYHQKCHRPEIDSSVLDNSDDHDWICATCSYILNQSNPSKLVNNLQQQQPKQSKSRPDQQSGDRLRPKATPAASVAAQKQTPKVKETTSVETETKTTPAVTTASPTIKSTSATTPKQTPHYPLSGQVRAASSSTAALASMTASSASIVGSPAGRTKQDFVNQSNRSSQRQQHLRQPGNVEVSPIPPVKHAVRKSSVNFPPPPPVRQSALPTATRSIPSGPPAKLPRLAQNPEPTPITKPIAPVGTTTNLTPTVTATIVEHRNQPHYQVTISNNSSNSARNPDILSGSTVRLIPRQPIINPRSSVTTPDKSSNQQTATSSPSPVGASPVTVPTSGASRAPTTNNTKISSTVNTTTVTSSPSTTSTSSTNSGHNRNGKAEAVVAGEAAATNSNISSPQSASSAPAPQQNNSDSSSKAPPHPTVIVSFDSTKKLNDST